MQIVIEINDNEYAGIKEYPNNITSYPVTIHLYDAVRNGTPLPLNEYEDIIAKYADDFALVSKKIDEWCIQTMRGIVGSYYRDKILKEGGNDG